MYGNNPPPPPTSTPTNYGTSPLADADEVDWPEFTLRSKLTNYAEYPKS